MQTKQSLLVRFLALALLPALFGAPARAQTEATGLVGRHVGLGGGGIALPGPNVSTMVNPAALASPVGLRVLMPQVILAGMGEKNRDALDNIIEHGDLDHLTEVGPGFLEHRHYLWIHGEQGVRFKTWEIALGGGATVAGKPNALTRRWFRVGRGDPPVGARLTVDTGYYYGGVIGYGHRFEQKSGDLDLGLRVSPFTGRWQRTVFVSNIDQDIDDLKVRDREDAGFGLDVGLRYAPRALKNTTFGLVGRGLNEPGIGRLRKRLSVDFGVAHRLNDRTILVADWMNINSPGFLNQKVGAGVEFDAYRGKIILRGAVTSRGLAGGIQLGPVQFGYTRDGETLVNTGLSF